MKKPFAFISLLILTAIISSCNNEIASFGKYTLYQKIDDSNTLILVIKNDDRNYTFDKNLNIDLPSLIDEDEFMYDKNKAYRKYDIDGGTLIFELENIDFKTFKVYPKSIYARDSFNIFDSRNGILENVDVNSFIPLMKNDNNVTGKDKNNYYFWNKIVEDTVGFESYFRQMEK